MSPGWSEVALRDILHRSLDPVSILPDHDYRQVTVRMNHRGVKLRGVKRGHEMASTQQYRTRTLQLIVSRIDARNGAVGLVPPELDHAIVTNDFWLFDIDASRVLPSFLDHYVGTRRFVEQCRRASEGTTNRVRLQPERFLDVKVPLPALLEQRRIVARIEGLATKIEEARKLRSEADELRSAVVSEEEIRIWPPESIDRAPRLAEVTTYLSRGRQSRQGPSDHCLIKTQHVQMGRYVPTTMTLAPDAAARVQEDALVRTDDVLIACSAAGCLGRVAFYDGPVGAVSTDTHVAIARANTTVVDPEYLYCYLRGAQGQRQLRSRERGDWQREKVGFRLTELNLADLKQVPVPLPPLPEQRSIVRYLHALYTKVSCATQIASVVDRELSLLTPAILSRAFDGGL